MSGARVHSGLFFFLSLTWLVWAAGGAIAGSLISGEKLLDSSIDSQPIRLVMRLVTVVVAIAILVAGADRIGLPAYSALAGLGVGGLAVALAAQQTLANLLGSLIIMFEKPFAVGHFVKVEGIEGTVENVGFLRNPDSHVSQLSRDDPEQPVSKQHHRQHGIARVPSGQDSPQSNLRHAR